MSLHVSKTAPYVIDVGSRAFCLKLGKSIECDVHRPTHGVIDFSIEGLSDLEWYEANGFDEVQFDSKLKECFSLLIKAYMLEEDNRLSFKARLLKFKLLDMFYERKADK